MNFVLSALLEPLTMQTEKSTRTLTPPMAQHLSGRVPWFNSSELHAHAGRGTRSFPHRRAHHAKRTPSRSQTPSSVNCRQVTTTIMPADTRPSADPCRSSRRCQQFRRCMTPTAALPPGPLTSWLHRPGEQPSRTGRAVVGTLRSERAQRSLPTTP